MQRIGIGYEFYKEFVDQELYYADKTLLIKDVLENGGKTTLFLRPRRFGKTLALTTLQAFFECECDREGNVIDNRHYFEGKKIMEAGEEVLSHMGQYPVIFLTLKSAKRPTFEDACLRMISDVVSEFGRHDYILASDALPEKDRNRFLELLNGEAEWMKKEKTFSNLQDRNAALRAMAGKYSDSMKVLSECLKLYHKKNAVILIDEYDVPLENAYFEGFYPEMVGFIRSFFESALKTNTALERAVITGCLRISRESIFTGLNNLKINSMLSYDFGEGFGFTQEETEAMLIAYGLEDKIAEAKDWYNGYLFGEIEVYNPWSITNYVYGKAKEKRKFPVPYWSNTSSNSIIRELVEQADEEMKEELELLIAGGTIEKQIHEDITYGDIHESEDNLWNFLFFTGYMRKVSERFEGNSIYVTMRIPNREVEYIYSNQITNWFKKIVKKTDMCELYRAIKEKDSDVIGDFVTDLLEKSISTFDSTESFYHGFFLSLVGNIGSHSARSNREAGEGRPDIILYPKRPKDPAYIFELKVRKKFNEMEDGLNEAFAQIDFRRYEDGIIEEGYAGVISYGICFCKKSCIVGLKP